MAVPFMPDQREGHGKLFSLRFIDRYGKGDQLALVELIILRRQRFNRIYHHDSKNSNNMVTGLMKDAKKGLKITISHYINKIVKIFPLFNIHNRLTINNKINSSNNNVGCNIIKEINKEIHHVVICRHFHNLRQMIIDKIIQNNHTIHEDVKNRKKMIMDVSLKNLQVQDH